MPTFAGQATDRFGGKWIAFVGILFSGLITAVTPIAIHFGGAAALIGLQTLLGGFLGFIYPSVFSLIVQWFPLEERSKANAGMIGGGSIGSALGSFLAGVLCKTSIGWPLVFYVTALIHVPWLIIWFVMITNDPKQNKFIDDEELKYLVKHCPKKIIRVSTLR